MRSRSNNVTATPCRARSVAAVEPAGPPPTTTTSSPLTRVVLHRLLDRAELELLVRGRIDVERAGQVQLPGHLATGWDDFLPHQAEGAHLVVVVHRAVAVPEEDRSRAKRLEHRADLRDDGLRRPGDDRHLLDLLFV